MSEKVSVAEAAKILGMSKQSIRIHMEKNLFKIPIGEVTNPSGRRHRYLIYRHMLNKHIGKDCVE